MTPSFPRHALSLRMIAPRLLVPRETIAPYRLGTLPTGRAMVTTDLGFARVPAVQMFAMIADVESWPTYLPHYRWVRMIERDGQGGGIVEMKAVRPFGPLGWPTFWRASMEVDAARGSVRFRHIGGLTTGMDVEWTCQNVVRGDSAQGGTDVSLVHVWDGWPIPLLGSAAAVVGPAFVHGIASRTMAGLITAAESM